MAIKAEATTPRTQVKRIAQEELPVSNYMCRVAQVIDLGKHYKSVWDDVKKEFRPDTGKVVHMAMLTYEFTTEFMKDEEGNDQEDRPRWLSEDFAVYPLDSDLAISTKRMKAFDPDFSKYKGDFALLANAPCTVTIAHKKNNKAKIGNVSPPMKGIPVPELKNPVKVFSLDTPDLEVYKSLPQWLQERISSNLEFKGSALEAALARSPVQATEDKPVVEKAQESAPVEPQSTVEEDDDNAPW